MSVSTVVKLLPFPLVVAMAIAVGKASRCPAPEVRAPAGPTAAVAAPLGALPLAFVENRGQWPGPARFVARASKMTAHFAAKTWVLDLRAAQRAAAVRIDFEGARDEARLVGTGELPGRHSFFRGNAASWRTGVPAFAALRCNDLYAGIDVVVRQHVGRIEYDLLLDPGADLERVVVRCTGIEGLTTTEDGALVLATAVGPIRQEPPTTWEVLGDGTRRPLACRYRLLDGERYGFAVPERDAGLALVIDPGLVWSTYLGGSGGDGAARLVRDPATGDVIVFGGTDSFDFPATTGAYDTSYNGGVDVTLSRISADGKTLVWATYLGGNDLEWCYGVAQERSGSFVVAGLTASKEPMPFPTTLGAYSTTHGGGILDAFVSRISADGSKLLYSSYLGGSASDWALDVDVDLAGIVTLVGVTRSKNFPTTPTAYDTTHNGSVLSPDDAFVTRLRLAGQGQGDLVASTYLGGSGEDGDPYQSSNWPGMREISVVSRTNGETTVAGRTMSTDFPTTDGAYDRTHNGDADVFVCRLDGSLSTLRWSTLLGGEAQDGRAALALDRDGGVVVAGFTLSASFPTTTGAFDTTFNGSSDAFVSRLDAKGSALVYSTYLGGGGPDELETMSVDSGGTITAAGTGAGGFPTTLGAYDPTWDGGPKDGIVIRLRTDGRGSRDLHYSTWIGGSQDETVWGGACDQVSAFYAFGVTSSAPFPTTPGAWDRTYGGNYDTFVCKLELLPTGAIVFGTSKQGCAGEVACGVTSIPQVGNADFAITCTGARPSTTLLLLLGAAPLPAPLPIPILGIDLWLDPTKLAFTLSTASNPSGYAEIDLPIPRVPALAGLKLYGQHLGTDTCRPLGFLASNGIELVIQP